MSNTEKTMVTIITFIIGLVAFIYGLYQVSIVFQDHFFPYLGSMFIFLLCQQLIKLISNM